MNGHSQSGRFYRLCQKELRESLRDRRTIITLVLMPLLVYPLLSMILQRLLLTSAPSSSSDEKAIRIGIEEESLLGAIKSTIDYGKHILAVRGSEILSIEQPDAPPSILNGPKSSQHIATQHLLGTDVKIFHVQRDGRQALLSGSVDILIRGSAFPDSSPPLARTNPENQTPNSTPSPANPATAPPRMRLSDRIRLALENMPEDRYRIEYVAGDRHSLLAVNFMRSLFATVNDEKTREIVGAVGAEYHPRISMSAAPIKLPNSAPTTLASLVPLVLVLMTIAGAVYPAIDLTAGERERGTLEAMIVSPTPRPVLLLSKYVAVVTVALLTALANLAAMTITLWASGLGRMFFGNEGLSLFTIGQILCLLVLFAMFFSAVLLSITSFAKSFKEAQAYLIPVMLVSLAPGVLSLLPQVQLTNVLAAVPLANIVLLSRDVLVGGASREASVIVVICTMVYAVAAIAIASRLFGSDASMQGSQGSWRDLVRRPEVVSERPTVDQMALTMACMFPLYFVASTSLPSLGGTISFRLLMSGVVSWLLIFGLPSIVSYYRRLNFQTTFLLGSGRIVQWLLWLPATLLLASSLWMIGHELMLFSQELGLATFSFEQMKQAEAFAKSLTSLPLALILFTGAITPAICEEWFFRGFVLSSLRRFGFTTAIFGSAFLFGLMHVLTSNVLSLERLLPSMFMGIVLGMVAWKTNALWPGVVLHTCHNGLLLSVGHYKNQLTQWGIGLEEQSHLPMTWLAGGLVAALIGACLLAFSPSGKLSPNVYFESRR